MKASEKTATDLLIPRDVLMRPHETEYELLISQFHHSKAPQRETVWIMCPVRQCDSHAAH